MALQMLQIFSSAGVCRSGHPKSSTWERNSGGGDTARGHIHAELCPLCSLQRVCEAQGKGTGWGKGTNATAVP